MWKSKTKDFGFLSGEEEEKISNVILNEFRGSARVAIERVVFVFLAPHRPTRLLVRFFAERKRRENDIDAINAGSIHSQVILNYLLLSLLRLLGSPKMASRQHSEQHSTVGKDLGID